MYSISKSAQTSDSVTRRHTATVTNGSVNIKSALAICIIVNSVIAATTITQAARLFPQGEERIWSRGESSIHEALALQE